MKKLSVIMFMLFSMVLSLNAKTLENHSIQYDGKELIVKCFDTGTPFKLSTSETINDFCTGCGIDYPFNDVLMEYIAESCVDSSKGGLFELANLGSTLENYFNTLKESVGKNMGQIGFVIGLLGFLIVFTWLIPVKLWIAAIASNVKVGIGTLIGMRFRGVTPSKIVMPLIKSSKAGLKLNINELEAHYLAGGNVSDVVDAIIAAERAKIILDFDRAAAIDLAGRDILEAVQMSVNPKVIKTNNVSAMSKDGIELLVDANVTVRANLERLVGGAGEATVLARIGEGIVTTVGSSASHKAVLENPDMISKAVLDKGLDIGTAYEILSIDIADIDIGRNIGAELQTKQAEADKQIAQAKAEERRAMAIAREQEMKAYVIEAQASVVKAEARVPEALAKALETGKMSAMDYYELKNLNADTSMRTAISDIVDGDKDEE